jgi:hypothetical protein
MRGVVTMIMEKMGGILKAVWYALISKLAWLSRTITVNGIALMTLIVTNTKFMLAWIVSNILLKLVPQIIQVEYKRLELLFVNKQAGQIGKLLLITVPLTLLLVLVHLILGIWRVLVAMMVKLLKRG